MIGDFLYGLTARDSQVDGFAAFWSQNSVTGGLATSRRLIFHAPFDRFALITSWSFLILADPAATITSGVVGITDTTDFSSQNFARIEQLATPVPAGQGVSLTRTGTLIVPPSHYVLMQAVWSATGGGNVIYGGVHGLMLPRGNLSLHGGMERTTF